MSNAKHTPGPWQFAMGGVTKDWPQVESPTGALIARTYDVNAEDNARLIAAAPAMLQVLRDLLQVGDSIRHDSVIWHDVRDAVAAACNDDVPCPESCPTCGGAS